jgi:predicted GNAT family acetyltransferase
MKLTPDQFISLQEKRFSMDRNTSLLFEERLKETPKVFSIQESDKVITKVGNVTIYEGIAKGRENYWNGKFITDRPKDFGIEIVKDNKGRFQFTLQRLSDEVVHLMCCSVSLEHQGKGLSKQMVKSIKSICFEHYDYHSIEARAAKPRNDPGIKGEDWRSFHVNFKGRSMTALERFWLSQKDCFPRRDYESDADPDQFLILNIKYN